MSKLLNIPQLIDKAEKICFFNRLAIIPLLPITNEEWRLLISNFSADNFKP